MNKSNALFLWKGAFFYATTVTALMQLHSGYTAKKSVHITIKNIDNANALCLSGRRLDKRILNFQSV